MVAKIGIETMKGYCLQSCVPFPWKLHEMLDDAASTPGVDLIVSWLPNGRSFKVFDAEAFVKKITPQYFKQTKYKSFQRQLNMWGFERIQRGDARGGYFHPLLVRGNASLCCHMKRTKIKGDGLARNQAPGRNDQQGSSDAFSGHEDKEHLETGKVSSTANTSSPLHGQEVKEVSSQPPSIPKAISLPSSSTIMPTSSPQETRSGNSGNHSETFFVSSISSCADEAGSFVQPQDGDCMIFEGRKFHFVADYHPANQLVQL